MASFHDLNNDILLEIASYLDPGPPPTRPHWHNPPIHLDNTGNDLRAFRAVSRGTLAAVPAPVPSWLQITSGQVKDIGAALEKWSQAPDDVLRHVRHITISPVSDNAQWMPSLAAWVLRHFTALLKRTPNLETLELDNHFLCTHDDYGFGRHRTWDLELVPGDMAPTHPPPALRCLSISLRCCSCSNYFTALLARWCTQIRTLRCPVLAADPLNPVFMPRLPALSTLYLKVNTLYPREAFLADIAQHAPSVEEIYLSPYDDSRKVQVLEHRQAPEEQLQRVAEQLGRFKRLRELDACLRMPETEEMREECVEVMRGACGTLERGWWWTQVGDLDYNQLKGYYRQGWRVESGEVVEEGARFLAPLVVRNEDGQGKSSAGASELWH